MYYKIKVTPNNYITADRITSDGYVMFFETNSPMLYTKGEAQKKVGIFGGKIEAVKETKNISTRSITQIPKESLLIGVLALLKGREAFTDATTNNELIYQGDVFHELVMEANEVEIPILKPSKEIMNQLLMLIQTVTTDYIQIITS